MLTNYLNDLKFSYIVSRPRSGEMLSLVLCHSRGGVIGSEMQITSLLGPSSVLQALVSVYVSLYISFLYTL